jgi:hypothetical protein
VQAESSPTFRVLLWSHLIALLACGARPNPFTTSVTASINLLSQTLIGASLESATGRQIKVLRYGDLYGPGTFSASWNGLDELNQPAPPGPYWIVMSNLIGSARTLVVLTRP